MHTHHPTEQVRRELSKSVEGTAVFGGAPLHRRPALFGNPLASSSRPPSLLDVCTEAVGPHNLNLRRTSQLEALLSKTHRELGALQATVAAVTGALESAAPEEDAQRLQRLPLSAQGLWRTLQQQLAAVRKTTDVAATRLLWLSLLTPARAGADARAPEGGGAGEAATADMESLPRLPTLAEAAKALGVRKDHRPALGTLLAAVQQAMVLVRRERDHVRRQAELLHRLVACQTTYADGLIASVQQV